MPRNKLQWNFIQNSNIFIQENALENDVCEMASILSWPQCVNIFIQSRVLGSLLSAHLIIKDPEQPFGDMAPPDYNDELLSLAHDLGNRLLPAFQMTPTGIPFPRVRTRPLFIKWMDVYARSCEALKLQDSCLDRLSQTLWNLTGTSAAVLPRWLSNFRMIWSL